MIGNMFPFKHNAAKVRACFGFILAIFALVISLLPMRATAQSGAVIEEVEIALWPEFDREAVLVIYRVHISPQTALPARLRVPVPVAAGEPYAVAWQNEAGQLLLANYESEQLGEWSIIDLTAKSRQAQVEFYLDYELVGTERSIQLVWPAGFAIGNLRYEIQEPPTADEFLINPEPDEASEGLYGLNYYRADIGPVAPDAAVRIEMSYVKTDDRLTVDQIETPAPQPTGGPISPEGGTPDVGQLLLWLLGGTGAILVALGISFYLRASRGSEIQATRRHSRKARLQSEPEEGIDASVIYCHQCGTRAAVSDNFCRHCGERLRR
jgi:hypothetical protein